VLEVAQQALDAQPRVLARDALVRVRVSVRVSVRVRVRDRARARVRVRLSRDALLAPLAHHLTRG
jgi:hypothetical protein